MKDSEYRCSCCDQIKNSEESISVAWSGNEVMRDAAGYTTVEVCIGCCDKIREADVVGVLDYFKYLLNK